MRSTELSAGDAFEEALRELPKEIADNLSRARQRQLSRLSLGNEKLNELSIEQWQALGVALRALPALQQLNLEWNGLSQLSPERWQAFCEALSQLQRLQQLNLEWNGLSQLSPERWQALGAALSQLQRLQQLDLSGNSLHHLSPGEWRAFGAALRPLPALQQLDLRSNGLHRLSREQWQAFCEALSQLQRLQQLDLSGNDLHRLSPEGWQALGAALSQLQALQQLNLSGNRLYEFSPAGWQALGAALRPLPALQQLNLNSNDLHELSPEGWQAFGVALSQLQALQRLNLSWNGLGQLSPEGWQTFGVALSQLPALQQLNLSRNYLRWLSPERWRAFWKMISKLVQLERLIIEYITFDALTATGEKRLALTLHLAHSSKAALYLNEDNQKPALVVTEAWQTYRTFLNQQPLTGLESLSLITQVLRDLPDEFFYEFLNFPLARLQRLLLTAKEALFEASDMTAEALAWLTEQLQGGSLFPNHPALQAHLTAHPTEPLSSRASDTPDKESKPVVSGSFSNSAISQALRCLSEAFQGEPYQASRFAHEETASLRARLLWARLALQPKAEHMLDHSPAECALLLGNSLLTRHSQADPDSFEELDPNATSPSYWYRVGLQYEREHTGLPQIVRAFSGKTPLDRYHQAMAIAALDPSLASPPFLTLLKPAEGLTRFTLAYTKEARDQNLVYLQYLCDDPLLTAHEQWQLLQAIAQDKSTHRLPELLKESPLLTEWYQRLQKHYGNELSLLLEKELLPWLRVRRPKELKKIRARALVLAEKENEGTLTEPEGLEWESVRLQLFVEAALQALDIYQDKQILFGQVMPATIPVTHTFGLLQHGLMLLAERGALGPRDRGTVQDFLMAIKGDLFEAVVYQHSQSPGLCFRASLDHRLSTYTTVGQLAYQNQPFPQTFEAFALNGVMPEDEKNPLSPRQNVYKALKTTIQVLGIATAIIFPYSLAFLGILGGVIKLSQEVFVTIRRAQAATEKAKKTLEKASNVLDHLERYYGYFKGTSRDAKKDAERQEALLRGAFKQWHEIVTHVRANEAQHLESAAVQLFWYYCYQLQPVIAELTERSAHQLGDALGALLLRGLTEYALLEQGKVMEQRGRLPEGKEKLFAYVEELLWRYANATELDDLVLVTRRGETLSLLSVLFPRRVQAYVDGELRTIDLQHGLSAEPKPIDSEEPLSPRQSAPVPYAGHYLVRCIQEQQAIFSRPGSPRPADPSSSASPLSSPRSVLEPIVTLSKETAQALQGKEIRLAQPSYQTVRELLRSYELGLEDLQKEMEWAHFQLVIQIPCETYAILQDHIRAVKNVVTAMRDAIKREKPPNAKEELRRLERLETEQLNLFDHLLTVLKQGIHDLRSRSKEESHLLLTLLHEQQPLDVAACNQFLLEVLDDLESMAKRYGPAFAGVAASSSRTAGILRLTKEGRRELLYRVSSRSSRSLLQTFFTQTNAIAMSGRNESQEEVDEKRSDYSSQRLFRARPQVSPATFKTRWAASAGFRLTEVSGDGNCFFTAIATLLNNELNPPTPHTAATVRAAAIAHLRKHEGTFNQGFGVGMELGTFEDYCTRMAKNGVWAEGPIIQATAACFEIFLTMIDLREEESGEVICHPIHLNEEAGEHAFTVLRTGEEIRSQHYDVLEPMEALQHRVEFG